MPNRILKESITTSDTIDALSAEEERLFYRLMVVCDDYGRYFGETTIIIGHCFPRKIGKIKARDVLRWLARLEEVGLLSLYTVAGASYLQITTWVRHQQMRAKRSKYPAPLPDEPQKEAADGGNCEEEGALDSSCNQLIATVSNSPRMRIRNPIQSESESESNTDTENAAAAPVLTPSPIQQVFDYYQSRILPGARLTDKAREKIKTRLQNFTVEELRIGIDRFRAHSWYMARCKSNGPAWFFSDDERSAKFLSLEPEDEDINGSSPGGKELSNDRHCKRSAQGGHI